MNKHLLVLAGPDEGRVFPLGPLRAPLGFQASMADAIVVLGESAAGNQANKAIDRIRESLIKSLPPSCPFPRKLALASLQLGVSASASGCGWEKGR